MSRTSWSQMWRGTVPWNADEFQQVMEWYGTLQGTPKDDWDLEARGFDIQNEATGKISRVTFNPFRPINQFGAFMVDRYGDQMPNHAYRFHKIMGFVKHYRKRLFRDGFAREGDNGTDELRRELIEALCMLRYSRVKIVDGEKQYSFSYKRVSAKVRVLLDKKQSDDGVDHE